MLDGASASIPVAAVRPDRGVVAVDGLGRVEVDDSGAVVASVVDGDEPGSIEALVIPAVALGDVLAGRFPLRAAAVSHAQAGVIIVGDAASGASTVAAALAGAGGAVLADMVTVVESGWIDPRGGRVELQPDAAAALGLGDGSVIRPGVSKRRYELTAAKEPVEATHLIHVVRSDHVERPEVATGDTFDAVTRLVTAGWHPWALEGLGLQPRRFEFVTALARRLSTARLTVPAAHVDPGAIVAGVITVTGGTGG
ncbi:MAG: hypothetical protein RIE08_07705 [Acidimicrobiales bacterium]